MTRFLISTTLLTLVITSLAQTKNNMNPSKPLPAGYWSVDKSQPIVDKTQAIRLAPDLSSLTPAERKAVESLIAVGKIFQELYELQRHAESERAYQQLVNLDKSTGSTPATQNLLTLYRLFQGPIATTLDNKREPLLPVSPLTPGKNMYPASLTKEQIEQSMNSGSGLSSKEKVLDLRTVVRQVTPDNVRGDINTLKKYPVLATLHPKLLDQLNELDRDASKSAAAVRIYAIPYSVAYADQLLSAYYKLNDAADAVQNEDEEFAKYLRNRARDLLSDDYESGDASWVTGRFKNLNAQIGSYETYDDELFGVKTFFSFCLVLTRHGETDELRKAMKGLQALEDSLPYAHHKKIREDIPVGVYDVVADFAQSRGGNTATILPNESYVARRYGRTILLRANIMRDPNIFESTSSTLSAALGEQQARELTPDGNFYRTLWHEVGHYLGVDRTKDGRDLDEALQDDANTLEEMKADLVSLFVAEALHKQGYYTDAQLRSVYAGGILRVLQNNKPRRDQPYNTMQLMQWNFYLQNGLLSFDSATKTLQVHYEKYHDVVGKMLEKTLEVQYQGDKTNADKFIDQYATWDDNLHGVVAANIRAQQKYRFRLFKYAALGE
jgi:hypothetical protein